MIIKNDSDKFTTIHGRFFRPGEEKDIDVPKPKKKSKVKGDLNDDGKFDKKDKTIAGRTLAMKVK